MTRRRIPLSLPEAGTTAELRVLQDMEGAAGRGQDRDPDAGRNAAGRAATAAKTAAEADRASDARI